MNADTLEVMFSKASDLWGTPTDFFDRYNRDYRFTIDGAASTANTLLDRWFGPGSDITNALQVDWTGERVWLNPPYSMCAEFVAKAVSESIMNDVGSVLLLPARTDTRWFHEHIWATGVCKPHYWVKRLEFVRGRLKFRAPEQEKQNSAPFPSVVVVLHGDWQ